MDIDTLLEYFASHHIHMKAEWLQIAIDFVSSCEPEKKKNMHVLLFEQFIHSNLAESYLPPAKVPVVAVKAVIMKHMIFQGKIIDFTPFHLVSVINIARSAYEQYCERSADVNDLSWFHGEDERNEYTEQPTANFSEKRFLKFKLTDGQNVLHAIQYGEVEFLDEDAPSGLKILLISRVLLRRGILLLNSSNCQVLGGDIERKLSTVISPLIERLGAANIAKTRCEVALNAQKIEKQEAKTETRKANRSSNSAANLSTISPFLVRLPRPKQPLHTNQAETREARVQIKQEISEVERTAIVPPLQAIALQNGKVAVREENDLRCEETVHSPIQQWRRADSVVPTAVEMNDLPIPLDNTTLFMHNKLNTEKKRESRLPRALPIAEYFPVSRGGNRSTVKNRPQSSPAQSSIVMSNDTRQDVVDVHDSAALLKKLTSTNDPAPCTWSDHQRSLFLKDKPNLIQTSFHSNAHVEGRAPLLLPFENPEKTIPAYETPPSTAFPRTPQRDRSDIGNRNGTQFVIDVHNSIAANDNHSGNYTIDEDSDYISFIEKSFTEEFKQKQRQSAVHFHPDTNVPPTAIVPYKRPRRNETYFNVSGGVTRQTRSSDQLNPSAIMDGFINLKITLLADILAKRKFWMLPKTVNVMGVCRIRGELSAKHGAWSLGVEITDESMESQRCVVANLLLENLLSFTVKQCEKLSREKNIRELSQCKERAMEVMKSFQRLDLVFSLEVHPEKTKLPVIIKFEVCKFISVPYWVEDMRSPKVGGPAGHLQ